MMEYKGYFGKVEYDADARILHGEVVGLRDVVTFQSDSVDEIEKAFRESVDDYLAFCAERGEPPDKSFSGQFLVRAEPGLHRQLNRLAEASGRSLNALVLDYLAQGAARATAGSPRPAKRGGAAPEPAARRSGPAGKRRAKPRRKRGHGVHA